MATAHSRMPMETIIKACGGWGSSKVPGGFNTPLGLSTLASGTIIEGMEEGRCSYTMVQGMKGSGNMADHMVTAPLY